MKTLLKKKDFSSMKYVENAMIAPIKNLKLQDLFMITIDFR